MMRPALLATLGLALEAPTAAAAGGKPHIVYVLLDDYGWADAGWHRPDNWTDVQTPRLKGLVKEGVELDRHYVYMFCSPTRSAIQSGRNPIHVNGINMDPSHSNPEDKVSGYAGIPVNMTGMAEHMKAGGYDTHMYGKWDAGMATRHHTPRGRGYETSLFYFHHANDYWTMKASGLTDLSNATGPAVSQTNDKTCSQDNQAPGCVYEDKLFAGEVKRAVAGWRDGDAPLFIFWALHIVHAPYQVPQEYLDMFSFIGTHGRQFYHAMTYYADEQVGAVADLLKAQGMWDDTLIVLHSDNGGPIAGGANNYPLKGGKFSNWEGGIRVNAFAAGGYLPAAVRGTKLTGLICAWDWYTTFAKLAGVDPTDHKAARAGLPPVDGVDVWPYLSGRRADSPRTTVPIGNPGADSTAGPVTMGGLIDGSYKIVVGNYSMSGWAGPTNPNSTVHWNPACLFEVCGTTPATGCLYDIYADPGEHHNIAAAQPRRFRALLAKMHTHAVFNPNRGGVNPDALKMGEDTYGGYWGPFVLDV